MTDKEKHPMIVRINYEPMTFWDEIVCFLKDYVLPLTIFLVAAMAVFRIAFFVLTL